MWGQMWPLGGGGIREGVLGIEFLQFWKTNIIFDYFWNFAFQNFSVRPTTFFFKKKQPDPDQKTERKKKGRRKLKTIGAMTDWTHQLRSDTQVGGFGSAALAASTSHSLSSSVVDGRRASSFSNFCTTLDRYADRLFTVFRFIPAKVSRMLSWTRYAQRARTLLQKIMPPIQ